MADAVEILISFDRHDEVLLIELENQLIPLQRKGIINFWDVRQIPAGKVSSDEIDKQLNRARIILFLISPDFVASNDYTYVVNRAMKRQQAGEATVIPVLLRPVYWEDEAYGSLKALPDNRKPVSSWNNRADAFYNIAEGLRKVVLELNKASNSGPASGVTSEVEHHVTGASTQNATSARGNQRFDVFLCHNNQDKPAVKQIAAQLQAHAVRPWLDEWELQPGLPWQRTLEKQIGQIKSAAVFVGQRGIGPWQQQELDAFLREFLKRGCPVIPVILKDSPTKPQLPVFLRGMTWVDFRKDVPDPMFQLLWGITGKRPDRI